MSAGGDTIRDLVNGKELTVRYPRHAYLWWVLGALIFLALAPLPIYQAIAKTPKAPSNPSEWLGAFVYVASFGLLAAYCIAQIPRLLRVYSISDMALKEKGFSGNLKSVELSKIASISDDLLHSSKIIRSSDGAKIAIHGYLPGGALIHGLCRASLTLNRHKCTGERLIERFRSALSGGIRIEFCEHEQTAFLAGFTIFTTLVGIFWIWYGLFSDWKPSLLLWQVLIAIGGIIAVCFSALVAWAMFRIKRETVIFFDSGFVHGDSAGNFHDVPWAQVGSVHESGEHDAPLVVKGLSGEVLAQISAQFREFFAIAYFIEHMRD